MDSEQEVDQFNYTPTDANAKQEDDSGINELEIEWQASEFIDHQKSSGWFLALLAVATVGAVLMYIITRNYLSTIVVVMAVFVFGFAAKQKPRTLRYALLTKTMQIGQKEYIYDDFISFSMNQDSGLPNISLQPLKRFIPVLTIYFAPEDAEKIFDVFASHLPHAQLKADAVDKFMKRIRF